MIDKNREGLLEGHNLWGFWDGIIPKKQNEIVQYFESHPGFWDYKTLFIGNSIGSIYHGVIHCLDTLLVLDDLELCDYFFSKMNEYGPENYQKKSRWGDNRDEQNKSFIDGLSDCIQRRKVPDEIQRFKIIFYG
jgi:hypothetical protein